MENVLKQKPFASPSITSRRHAIAALQAVMYFCRTATPKDAQYSWQTCAVAPQDLVRNLSSGKTFWIMAVAADAAVVWEAAEIEGGKE